MVVSVCVCVCHEQYGINGSSLCHLIKIKKRFVKLPEENCLLGFILRKYLKDFRKCLSSTQDEVNRRSLFDCGVCTIFMHIIYHQLQSS